MTADTDRVEALLGRLLTTGVRISNGLLAVGLVLWAVGGPNVPAALLLHAGLLALIATPVARVIVSLVEYVRERDWFFALTTAAVLAVLAVTVAVALAN